MHNKKVNMCGFIKCCTVRSVGCRFLMSVAVAVAVALESMRWRRRFYRRAARCGMQQAWVSINPFEVL
jgi:hypothetical protein